MASALVVTVIWWGLEEVCIKYLLVLKHCTIKEAAILGTGPHWQVGETVQSVKGLLHEHVDQSLGPQHSGKADCGGAQHPFSAGQLENENPWSSLASSCTWTDELQAQWKILPQKLRQTHDRYPPLASTHAHMCIHTCIHLFANKPMFTHISTDTKSLLVALIVCSLFLFSQELQDRCGQHCQCLVFQTSIVLILSKTRPEEQGSAEWNLLLNTCTHAHMHTHALIGRWVGDSSLLSKGRCCPLETHSKLYPVRSQNAGWQHFPPLLCPEQMYEQSDVFGIILRKCDHSFDLTQTIL